MKLLKKIWTELTRPRSIRFDSFETESEQNKRLQEEILNRKIQIATENYKKVMNERLIPFCRDLELSNTGLLLPDIQLFEKAHSMFIQAKKDGRLDELNNIVGVAK
jgi:hypothetical protein